MISRAYAIFFFFQAEDGIRDKLVTGIQTCALPILPEAQVWHIGLFRDERTLRPIEYYNKLPSEASVQVCLVLDPMLATGGSATATVDVLKKWGAKRVKYVGVIAAPEGVRT